MTLIIAPTGAALGAVATGIDLGSNVEDTIAAEIKMALCQHGVLAFPNQRMTPESQVALTRKLGEPEVHVLSEFAIPDMPEIFIVSNVRKDGKPIGAVNAGQYWHSDLSYTARPTFASMLHAKEVPPGRGETLFASMVRAYETLSDEIKIKIEGCYAIHDYTLAYETVFAKNPDRVLTEEQAAEVPPVKHPVIRKQVETGRKAIYVNPGFTRRIVEMDEEESRNTLETLFTQATDPENIYTHHWQVGDFLMWDNRITMHMAMSNYTASDARHLLRTSVTGEVPIQGCV